MMDNISKLEQVINDIQSVVLGMSGTKKASKVNKTYWSPDNDQYPIVLSESDLLTHDLEVTGACLNLWLQTTSAVNNKYLRERGVSPYGTAEYKRQLVVPIRKEGLLLNLQFIDQAGATGFLSDMTISGGYHRMGKPSSTLIIGTDFIEVASAYKATGYMSVSSITIDNLPIVIPDIRARYPDNKLVVLTERKLVADKESELAKTIVSANAYIAVPPESSSNCRTYNDVLCQQGVDALAKLIEGAERFSITPQHNDVEHSTSMPAATLINEIINAFYLDGAERLFSRDLVKRLLAVDDKLKTLLYNGKPLTQKVLANLLISHNIKPKKVRIDDTTGRGYLLEQFQT